MVNYWLDSIEKKKLYRELDEIGMDIWSEAGTFGEFLAALNDEQVQFLMGLTIENFEADDDDFSFAIELKAP